MYQADKAVNIICNIFVVLTVCNIFLIISCSYECSNNKYNKYSTNVTCAKLRLAGVSVLAKSWLLGLVNQYKINKDYNGTKENMYYSANEKAEKNPIQAT